MGDGEGVLLALVLILTAFFFGNLSGCEYGRKEIRIEAVQQKHAEWTPKDDGTTEFKWIKIPGCGGGLIAPEKQ